MSTQRTTKGSRPGGHTFSMNFDGNTVEHDTLQCVHCGMHWEIIPGSGKVRGFCMKCMGPTCGKKNCELNCVPQEMLCYEPHKADRILLL